MKKSSTPKTRILLVDDHFFVRMGLAASLNEEPDLEVVAEAGSVAEALDAFRTSQPDVTLLDGNLPDGHGLDALALIAAEFPHARIVMLSVDVTEESVFRAIEAGALGYLGKSAPRQVLLHALREAAQGRTFLPPELEAKLRQRRQRQELTAREFEILRLVVKGTPNKLIADALGIAEMTVKVHLSRIFDKLGVPDRTSATTAALQRGLVQLG
jgi:DNA-binding NarL/FixJ family response regulator